jgi:aspartyl-tRNA(Asn)/glutamyl-tRNA(Gln) amidotransferase subunit A
VSSELVWLGAAELARRIRAKELSPVEVVQAMRERADAVAPALNALVTPFPDAEERAREAERAVARGDALGPLHGVPCTLKDCFDTAGVLTTRGSALFADRVPETDATVVTRLRTAGAIPLAKSNTPEFALWWETDNLVFGRTTNPWDAERTAGGSSGGEAAAVGAGLSPLGVGSDLGGSIRMPAHYCGAVGLKPTHGRVPLTGHWPEVLLGFMHAGPLARSVEDAWLALSVLEGPDGRDWHAAPASPLRELASRPRPVTVGVLGDRAFGPTDPEVLACVRAAAAALGEAGCTVVEASIPGLERHDWNILTMTLYGAGGRSYFREVVDDRWDELHPRLRDRLSAPLAPIDDYLAAQAAVEELRRDVARFFEAHELLLCPTSLVPAHGHDANELTIAGTACAPRSTMRATIPFDLTGSPALTVPFGRSADGLPIGVQLVGRRFDDATVLEAGLALERARGPLPRPG